MYIFHSASEPSAYDEIYLFETKEQAEDYIINNILLADEPFREVVELVADGKFDEALKEQVLLSGLTLELRRIEFEDNIPNEDNISFARGILEERKTIGLLGWT